MIILILLSDPFDIPYMPPFLLVDLKEQAGRTQRLHNHVHAPISSHQCSTILIIEEPPVKVSTLYMHFILLDF